MKLQDWLKENQVSVAVLAAELKVQRSTVYRWIKGTRVPDPKLMLAIFDFTSGAVRPDHWCGLVDAEE